MLIFHEGLPGSGKSFEACVKHIVPALQKGRKVFAYIEGLNHEKFSEVFELPQGRVKDIHTEHRRRGLDILLYGSGPP